MRKAFARLWLDTLTKPLQHCCKRIRRTIPVSPEKHPRFPPAKNSVQRIGPIKEHQRAAFFVQQPEHRNAVTGETGFIVGELRVEIVKSILLKSDKTCRLQADKRRGALTSKQFLKIRCRHWLTSCDGGIIT